MVRYFFLGSQSKEQVLTQLRVWRELYRQQHVHFAETLPEQMEVLKQVLPHSTNQALIWETLRRLGEDYMGMFVAWLDETIAIVEDGYDDSMRGQS